MSLLLQPRAGPVGLKVLLVREVLPASAVHRGSKLQGLLGLTGPVDQVVRCCPQVL